MNEPRAEAIAVPGLMPLRRATIEKGTCHVLFAYDVGFAIDLDRSEELITAHKQRAKIKYKRRAPQSLHYSPAPLRVTQVSPQIKLAGFETSATVDAVLYDFGAVCIIYAVPVQGDLPGLLALSNELYDNQVLLDDSQRWVRELVDTIQPAVARTFLSPFVEDYVIFQIESLSDPIPPDAWLDTNRELVAQILRSETQPLSEQEVSDALSCRTSYGRSDLTLIDWNAAMVFDPDAEDVRTILEFANVELLEVRYLDQKLDTSLTAAYEALSRRSRHGQALFGSFAADLRRVAQMQADSATLFEGVNNALKLIGDQYLARLYRAASGRLHLQEWDEGIIRKLHTLESIYSKMSDQQSTRRMEILEWIIIFLIAVSIVLPFLPWYGGGH